MDMTNAPSIARRFLWDDFATGVSEEATQLYERAEKVCHDFVFPVAHLGESIQEKFFRLAAEWKAATAHFSLALDMATHPAYQQIIGLGEQAIPLLLGELVRDPDHWFWALTAITGVDPVPPADRGRIRKMTSAWLEWGRVNGFAIGE